ncbi:ATP synthase F1 subunit epsilon [bacterium]|nr:ATP synthase F1 subunit epsilon [bacterium]
MKLKIITHEKTVFDSEVDELVLHTTNGQVGILKDHIPLTTSLEIGVTKARIGDKYRYFATMGGIFQFKENNATILTDVCEDSDDIDVARAKAAKERAQARLADTNANIDAQRAQAALARSLARLQAALQKGN